MRRPKVATLLGMAVVLLAVPTILLGQNLPCRTYGDQKAERALALVERQSEVGGYVMAGWTTSFTTALGDTDVLIVQTDSNGLPVSPAKVSIGPAADVATSMIRTTEGGYAVCGYTRSFGVGLPLANVFVLKLDASLNLIWGNVYGRENEDRAYSIIEARGGYTITGMTVAPGTGTPRVLVMRLDAVTGNLVWATYYGQNNAHQMDDEGYGICEIPSLPVPAGWGYAVVGRTVPQVSPFRFQDAFVLCIDSFGNPVYQSGQPYYGTTIIPGVYEDEAWSVIWDQGNNSVVVAGFTNSYAPGAPGQGNIFIWKLYLQTNGVLTTSWVRTYGWMDNDELLTDDRSLILTNDHRYAVSGWTCSQGPGTPSPNFLTMKLDTTGTIIWSRVHPSLPGEGSEEAYPMIQTMAGNYAIAGWTNSHWAIGGQDDFHFVTLDQSGNRPVCVLNLTPPRDVAAVKLDSLFATRETYYPDHIVLRDTLVQSVEVCSLTRHDVGCTKVMAPTGTIDSGTVVTPACSVYNYGNATENYPVRMRIGASYDQTVGVATHAPLTYQVVTFPTWTAMPRGPLGVRCSTELTGDADPTNDKAGTQVTVRVIDVGATKIVAPPTPMDSGTSIAPACSVYNYGTTTEGYAVRMKIGSFYNRTAQVSGHTSLTRLLVTFPSYADWPRGNHNMSCSTELSTDMDRTNDKVSGGVTVAVHDVGCAKLSEPAGTIDSGTGVTPACSVYNYGTATEGYSVRMKIGAAYNQTVGVSGHGAGTRLYLTFPAWTASPVGSHATSCSTELATDAARGNDKKSGQVVVRQPGGHDVSCTRLIAPLGEVDSGTAVAPACSVHNYGAFTESYTVRMKIGASYDQTVGVTSHGTGTSLYLTFPSWTAAPVGGLAVRCSTELAGDNTPANDKQSGTVTVRRVGADVGCAKLIAPAGSIPINTVVTPACSVYNWGSLTSSYQVKMRIGTAYYESAAVAAHAPATYVVVSFPIWTATPAGNYPSVSFTELSGDVNVHNDTAIGTCTVTSGPRGWIRKADVPIGPKRKGMKDGGCLAYKPDSTGEYVYALKGNNRSEFYKYDAAANTWATKESIPVVGSSGKKKRVKKGGCMTRVWVDSTWDWAIGAAKGNNTVEWWRYDPYKSGSAQYPWTQMADIPAGTKACKEGCGAAGVQIGDTGFVYFLKGSGTQEFYRYNAFTNVWESKTSAPAGLSGKPFKKGSCVTHDGSKIVYALKGGYNEFYAYDTDSDKWVTKTPLPLIGRSGRKKKAGDGAGLAYDGGIVYCLKGNNTQEFWFFDVLLNSWLQGDDIPSASGKRVKAGGALVAIGGGFDGATAVNATVGNNTCEFYSYPLTDDIFASRTLPNIELNPSFHTPQSILGIAPNPFRGTAVISYALARSGNVNLRLYDVTGKLVTVLRNGYDNAGSYLTNLDATELARGIYILKLETESHTTTQKLIIE
jgi:hypothetical protein